MQPEKVFISYASGDKELEEFVVKLSNKLRSEHGFEAITDKTSVVNDFNDFMITGIMECKKAILVVNEKYVRKANKKEGGVGKETQLLYEDRFINFDKIVPIKVDSCRMPFYLGGVNYVDFTKGDFNDNIKKLVLRLNDIPEYEPAEITQHPAKIESKKVSFEDDLIPNFDILSTEGRNEFMYNEFKKVDERMMSLLKLTKQKNKAFDYHVEHKKEVDNSTSGYVISNGMYEKQEKTVDVCIYRASANGKGACFTMWFGEFAGLGYKTIQVNFEEVYNSCYNSCNVHANFDSKSCKLHVALWDRNHSITDGYTFAESLFLTFMEKLK